MGRLYSLRGADASRCYDAHLIQRTRYQLTMLAYDTNGELLSYGTARRFACAKGFQLGFKQGNGSPASSSSPAMPRSAVDTGGYKPDHEFFGYGHSL